MVRCSLGFWCSVQVGGHIVIWQYDTYYMISAGMEFPELCCEAVCWGVSMCWLCICEHMNRGHVELVWWESHARPRLGLVLAGATATCKLEGTISRLLRATFYTAWGVETIYLQIPAWVWTYHWTGLHWFFAGEAFSFLFFFYFYLFIIIFFLEAFSESKYLCITLHLPMAGCEGLWCSWWVKFQNNGWLSFRSAF